MSSKRLFVALRTVHIYLTLASFVLLLLFAVTGILLVHYEAFGLDRVERRVLNASFDRTVLEHGDRLAIVEQVRRLGAFGAVESYEDSDGEVHVCLARPAGRAEATIVRATGACTLTLETHGALALLGDLHKGKQSGAFWVVIDVAGVLWILASVTGICLWWQLTRRRLAGAMWLCLGTIATIGSYLAFVP